MDKTLKALALIVGLGVAQNAAASNLLVNGDFELPVQVAPNFATFNIPTGSPTITVSFREMSILQPPPTTARSPTHSTPVACKMSI